MSFQRVTLESSKKKNGSQYQVLGWQKKGTEMTEKKTAWMTSLGHSGDIHNPITPERDTGIQPYFHFTQNRK
ncbi:hypothetical protein [Wolbachia endosymbiont of Ctenocephalides felis wCfeJ]|uniref:hypothetical protein n=1 Tax=Wolbachia endosymbiont of Ctenocephalides felis wCfeJ TaxID=2732594 RepID=UPI001445A874|nr:hypothetical protein [Wolbachia endosymbiont of Ctenocephalides felis wCfeJ]